MSDDDVVAIVKMLKSGKGPEQVANDLNISIQMVSCAVRKWPYIREARLLGC